MPLLFSDCQATHKGRIYELSYLKRMGPLIACLPDAGSAQVLPEAGVVVVVEAVVVVGAAFVSGCLASHGFVRPLPPLPTSSH